MENKVVKLLLIIVILLSLLMIYDRFSGGISLSAIGSQNKIDEVYELVKDIYVDDVSDSALSRLAIEGLLSGLDPHSVYLSQDEVSSNEEEMKGEFEGIGIEFQMIEDTVNIVSVMSGGPSEKAGLLPGDKIVTIDKKAATGISTDQIRMRIKGKAGTKVSVGVVRYGHPELKTIIVTRGKIPVRSVTAGFMLDDKTGYLNIVRFAEKTSTEVLDMLNSLRAKGMSRIVLDLRSNPGGYLQEAVKIADFFLDGSKVIVSTRGRISQANEVFNAEKQFVYEKMPLVILINRSSASASEILAGAIQDWDRGLVIGERSFGKGLVQQQIDLSDGSAVRLTIAKYFTPLGRSIQRQYTDRDEYYDEISHREEEDSLVAVGKMPAGELPSFSTPKKRKLLGGGGIMPDHKSGKYEGANQSLSLLRSNYYSQVSLSWFEKNGERIKRGYKSPEEYNSKFNFGQADIQYFRDFALRFGGLEELTKDDRFTNRIKAEIARYIWQQQGFYLVYMSNDESVNTAITLMDESAELASLKKD